VLVPIGFVSDHIEVLYDLDTEARGLCAALGIRMVRAGTAGAHPAFVGMIRDLILERISGAGERPALGRFPACPDVCPEDCCPVAPQAMKT
jgi:ferrochelatase